jgi:hypothetical protein
VATGDTGAAPAAPAAPRAWTGRTDCTTPSVEHATLAEAEAWIAEREKDDPEGVARGDYFIDVDQGEDEDVCEAVAAKFTILWLTHNGNVIGREHITIIVDRLDDDRETQRLLRRRAVLRAAVLTRDLPATMLGVVNIVAGFRVIASSE